MGNPTADEVRLFRKDYQQTAEAFKRKNGLALDKPVIALLAGSRRQEIKDNLPAMIEAAGRFPNCQMVLAGAPSIEEAYYEKFISGTNVVLMKDQTYALLSHSAAALVTSGTATLETALLDVPQVVCYETPVPHLIRFAFNHIIQVKYISLVNLIADREVVQELLADRFTVDNIAGELNRLLNDMSYRAKMLQDYADIRHRLGDDIAPDQAAKMMIRLLKNA